MKNFIILPRIFSLFVIMMMSLPFLKLTVGQVNYFNTICDPYGNYSKNSVYETNLNLALANLSSHATAAVINDFYNFTVGTDSDQVYALYLCRGDVNPKLCQSCVETASNMLTTEKCPNNKVAVIWYDECMLRYSNVTIISIATDTGWHWRYWYSTFNVSNPNQLSQVLSVTMNELIEKAVSTTTTPPYFQTGEAKLTNFETLYCLVQCSPDIKEFECKRCLQIALTNYPKWGPVGSTNAKLYGESCQMSYDIKPFYTTAPASPPPLPPSIPPATNNISTRKGGNGTRRRTITIISIVLSLVILMAALVGFLYILKRKRSIVQGRGILQDGEERNVESQDQFLLVPLDLIIKATQGFSKVNKLGEGGFGPVYKGTLVDGKEIAVKRLSRSSGQGLKELKNEVSLIAKLQHRNLVKLVGCCLEGNESLLIYEYMPNKSLDFLIFDSTRAPQLDWSRRLNIIDGIARGLLYLHEDSRLRIIHRDLKAGNILLDHEMNAKISDFGLARIVDVKQSGVNTRRVVGTYGYMPPEYAFKGLFSVKSDVFSFGVLLLEIISGKRNCNFDSSESGKSLLMFAWEEWRNNNGLKLMDQSLVEMCVTSEVLKCIHIGLLCVQENPSDRPTMSSVVVMLRSDTMKLPKPGQPAFSIKQPSSISTGSSSQEVKAFSNNMVTISNISCR
ncbi:cysteine-rich receptor-like protein kinase 15 [Impatiens glandulifera]|uniref:cysteine-rich receptor-like protein kinase 15 n=1 Tax=Impatiens glandulifera TaxID=253017 RepID=UPI001FB195F2|nr:cysteine-rich receptor-like protein kinase 15 [Impatiens glandulifera]